MIAVLAGARQDDGVVCFEKIKLLYAFTDVTPS